MTGITPNLNLQTFNQIYGAGYQPSSMVSLPVSSNTAPLNTVPSASAPNLNTNNQLEKTPKSDTITIAGKTIKKKTAIIGGLSALAAVAAVGAAMVFGAGRGKTPAVPPEVKVATEAAEAMTQKASELAETVQKKIDVVIELFKNGGKDAEGKTIAQILPAKESDRVKLLQELDDSGHVIRESYFVDDILRRISEPANTTDLYINNAFEYVDEIFDGGRTITRALNYTGACDNYRPAISYSERYAVEGAEFITKRIDFDLAGKVSNSTYSEEIAKGGEATRKVLHQIKNSEGENIFGGYREDICEGFDSLRPIKDLFYDGIKRSWVQSAVPLDK